MYQYDDPTAVAALPVPAAVGTPGYFTDGSPGSQAATILRADFMNMLMMEMLNVVTAGGQAPSKTAYNQLLLSIESLIEARSGNYALDTGAENAYVVALSPAINAYTNGLSVRFRAGHANTGASTLNAGGGVVPLLNDVGGALVSGDLPAGAVVTAVYDSGAGAFLVITLVPSQVLTALQAQRQSYATSAAGGTADAITGSYTPGITALANGMALYVRAASANATTTPTFTPNSGLIPAKTIVKGNGLALAAGDIAGGGHWIELQYDQTLDKWVLLNPATGVTSQAFASNAEAQALTVSNKAISPATLAAALQGANQSLVSNGYQKLPGGLILQWGSGTLAAASLAVSFPITFPASVFGVYATDTQTGAVSTSAIYSITAANITTSGFTAGSAQGTTAGAGGVFNWFAIGN